MAEPLFLRSPLLAAYGIDALFSTRHGGVGNHPFNGLDPDYGQGAEAHADDLLLRRLTGEAGMMALPHQARQVHGVAMLHCQGDGMRHSEEADILLASEPGVALAVRTADCVPILLGDPVAGTVAAVHAGWRGTEQRAVAGAVAELCRMGAKAERMVAAIGPAIGACCFEVDAITASRLAACCDGGAQLIRHSPTPHPDLFAINRQQLLEAGLASDHIELLAHCTFCDPQQRFHSYRRDKEQSGRQLSMVGLMGR